MLAICILQISDAFELQCAREFPCISGCDSVAGKLPGKFGPVLITRSGILGALALLAFVEGCDDRLESCADPLRSCEGVLESREGT